MPNDDILEQLTGIFINILDNATVVLTNGTTAEDIEEWDSLTHIQLVVAIEKYFKIRFTSKEIQGWKNVGEMVQSIAAKQINGQSGGTTI
ncbi:MAG: acyl carrier protein [Bacteroidota bacterium]